MNTEGFGKPKFGGGTYAKSVRLKEGSPVIARILPPMKSLAKLGTWAVYLGTHFGYRGVNTQDRSKPKVRTFKCIEEKNMKTGFVKQACPECDLIASKKHQLEKLKSDNDKLDPKELEELVRPFQDWLQEHNVDRKWHMNVRLLSGEFAVLQISHKTKKLLDAEIGRILAEDGIEALALDQGVWFRFTRTGKGIDTQDTISVEYETTKDPATGRLSRVVKLAPLTEAEAEKALNDCPDLTSNLKIISLEQIQMLVDSSGDDEDVDAIFALGEKKESSPAPRPTAPTPVRVTAPPPAPVVVQLAETEAEPEEDEETALQAQLAKLQAKKAAQAAKATATPVAPVAATVPSPSIPIDRAAFMSRFEKPKT